MLSLWYCDYAAVNNNADLITDSHLYQPGPIWMAAPAPGDQVLPVKRDKNKYSSRQRMHSERSGGAPTSQEVGWTCLPLSEKETVWDGTLSGSGTCSVDGGPGGKAWINDKGGQSRD